MKQGDGVRSTIFAECAGISDINETQQETIKRFVDRILVYPEENGKLGLTTLTEHSIALLDTTPINNHPRRMSPRMQQIPIEEVESLFDEGIIERSASDYSSALVMIRKSDGTYRFCVDYRDLNRVTRKDAYPIPSMDSILDKLRRARYLTKIDLKQAYYQIPMEQSSRKYTAFAVPGLGLWQFKRMPLGLTNAPMTFQRLVDSLFGPEFQPSVFGYLDDIIIATETFEEHVMWIELVLKRLVEANIKVNKEKCEVCCSRVTYLGFLLDEEGLRSDPDKIAPVLEYPAPKNIKQLRRFLGMVGRYARFIKGESSIKIPLVKLLRKGKEWQLGEEQDEQLGEEQDEDMHIHEFRHAVNTATQSSTKVSPAFLNFGRHPKPVKSLRREVEGVKALEKIEPAVWEDRIKRLDALRDLVGRHVDESRQKQEKHYNKGRRDVRFNVGDRVLRKTPFRGG